MQVTFTMKKYVSLVIFLLFLTGCHIFDFSSDSYSEKKTLELFIGIPDKKVMSTVSAIRVYYVPSKGIFSEKWLLSNSDLLITIKDKEEMLEIIDELHFKDNGPVKRNFQSDKYEYHLIFEFQSGEKAYLRLYTESIQKEIVTIDPFAPLAYQVNFPKILFHILINQGR